MTEPSRRSFLRTAAVSGALTGGAVLLPGGLARAATAAAAPRAVPQPRATTYRLRVTNNSPAFEQFAVYQNDPDLGVYDVMSLAWFVKGAQPGQTVVFEWDTAYSFLLFADGGTTVTQTAPADPSNLNANQIALTYAYGVYSFQPGPGFGTPQLGNLYINETSSIPVKGKANVGIGMSGSALYSTRAQPNMQLMFTPHPTENFFLTAGTFQTGQNLDVEKISHAAAVDFASGVFDLHATLKRDGTWTVSPSSTA